MNDNKITIIFSGDLFLNESYRVSDDVVSLFKSGDFNVANLEAPIFEDGQVCKPLLKAGPNLFQKEEDVKRLEELFNIKYFGLANNHIFDYGQEGIESTKKFLDKNSIKYGGLGSNILEAKKEIILDGPNIAIISVAEEEFGVAENERAGIFSMYSKQLDEKILELRSQDKFVIVFAHGGGEIVPLPSEYIKIRYREFVDLGVDLVVGHHPHVVQGYENYKGKMIFYSLGNFIHSSFKKSLGAILKFEIIDLENKNYKFELIPVLVENKQVIFLNDNRSNFFNYLDSVNKIILEENFFKSIYQEQVMYMYESYYHKYMVDIFWNIDKKIKNYIKSNIFKNNFDSHHKELFLLHLIRNVSHRQFIQEALMIKTGETVDYRTLESKKIFDSLINFLNSTLVSYESN